MANTLNRWLADTAERAALTFVEAEATFLIANQTNAWTLDQTKAMAFSGAIAVAVVVKSAIASRIGSPASASLLPSNPGPVPTP